MAIPVAAFIEMITQSVTTRATAAACAGCVQHGLGQNTTFSGRSSRNAAEDGPRPNIFQLNTEWLTASKISVIEQLAYVNKALIIVLQHGRILVGDTGDVCPLHIFIGGS